MRRVMNSVVDTTQFDRLYSRGDDINREMYNVLAKQSHAPFFAFINYMDAHFPYLPPAPFDHTFPGKDRALLQKDLEDAEDNVIHGQALSEHDHAHLTSQYDGGIAYTDAQIGELIAWLKEHNLYDNTLIVITSDHGEAFGERTLCCMAIRFIQNLLNVALLIKFPKNAQTGVVNDPVSLVDLAPTI